MFELVILTAAGFTLNLAAKRAVQLISLILYLKTHRLVQEDLYGILSLLGCLALCLAFLCVTCGTAMGCGAAIVMRKKQSRPPLETGSIGLAVFMGCGITGALLESAFWLIY